VTPLSIPPEGIAAVRSIWAGRGGLWDVVGAGDDWGPALARRRAARIVLELLRPHLLGWPTSLTGWLDALPAQSYRQRILEPAIGAGVDWPATRRSGWPPATFHHRRRFRVADTLLATAARWTIEGVANVVEDADKVDSERVGASLRQRLEVARDLLSVEPVCNAAATRPSAGDLAGLRAAGRPWGSVAAAAAALLILESDPGSLAWLALDPDPALAERLFHVAVFGCLVLSLSGSGWALELTALPGDPTRRPVFAAKDPTGRRWDVWYEASGAWGHYDCHEPYPVAVETISGAGGALGADLALISRPGNAVLIECKFSADPGYVGRNGYEQLLAYMTEAKTGLAHTVAGVLVGPAEVIEGPTLTTTAAGPIAVTAPSWLGLSLSRCLT